MNRLPLSDFLERRYQEAIDWVTSQISLVSVRNIAFYSSFDIRYSGFKVSQVDANLFPAGFNNLPSASIDYASEIVGNFCRFGGYSKVLIISEDHTRNVNYLKNVLAVTRVFKGANVDVRVCSLSLEAFSHTFDDGDVISLQKLIRKPDFFALDDGFVPDLILLNNDLTSLASSDFFDGISQAVLPISSLGWNNRKKSGHFAYHSDVIRRFSDYFSMDPWLFDSYFEISDDVNFKEGENISSIKDGVSSVLTKVRAKYAEYRIDHEPAVFVKSNSGTYGMGIEIVYDPSELDMINKAFRKKMHVIKSGKINTSVLLQEAVPTILQEAGVYYEPVYYSILGEIIGSFCRFNENGGRITNLNASGMSFKPNSGDIMGSLAQKACYLSAYLSILSVSQEIENARAFM